MTQAVNDPWAAAAMPQGNPAAGNIATPPAAAAAPTGSSFGDSYSPSGGSSLLGGEGGTLLLALFNISHQPGTTFSGKITKPPYAKQATSYPRNVGDPRLPLYWNGPQGQRKPGTDATDPRTGEPCNPIKDDVIEIQTDERWTLADLAAANITRPDDFEDDGMRVWHVSGAVRPKGHVAGQPVASAKRAMLDAIEAAKAQGIRFTSDESFVGLTITVQRVQRVQPGVSTSSWLWIAKLGK